HEEVGDHPGTDEAQRPEAFEDGDVAAAALGRDDFRYQREPDGELHAHAEAEQHTEPHQLLDILGKAAKEAADAPENHAYLKYRFAAELVGKHAGDGRTEKHSHETGTGQQARLRRSEAEFGGD